MLLLLLILLMHLCACAQIQKRGESDEPEMSTDAVTFPANDREKEQENQSEKNTFSTEARTALERLRGRLDSPMTMFGAAYLGYVGGLFEEGFEAGFPAWLLETNEAMLNQFPFISQIDADHMIGGDGHLYCIVPADENVTVAVNRIQWNESTRTDEITEVLYRSETGEPVLLFANLNGVAYEPDTQVMITDNSGNTCEWEPSLDAMSYLAPCMSEAGDCLSYDFTEYAQYNAPSGLTAWLDDGWTGVTAVDLAGVQSTGMGWNTKTMAGETSQYAMFSLHFYPGDETGGTVELEWRYETSDDLEEKWNGFWTIYTVPDGPGYVKLSLSSVDGKNRSTAEGSRYLCETYPLLISPDGTEILIGTGDRGICLPFMSQSTTACVLTQTAG